MIVQKQTAERKSGGILVVVMLMTLIVSILAIGMYKLHETGGVGVVRAKQSQQAFWLAEAGLRDAIQRLNWNIKEAPLDPAGYRDSPYVISVTNAGKGSYEVDIPVATPISGSNATNYTIISVGRVKTMNRRVQQNFIARPGSKFAIISVGGNSEFKSRTTVNEGGVAVFSGNLDTGLNDTVDLGDVYVDSDATLSGSGDYTETEMPSELEPPTFNVTSYQTRVANVVGRGTATDDIDVSDRSIPATANYTTNNVTFEDRLTVPSGAVISSYGDIIFEARATFNGPVTIEAGGNVIFAQSSPLPAGSTIIAGGDVDLAGSISVGSNVEITAGGNLAFGNQTAFDGHSIFYAEDTLSAAAGGGGSSVSGDGIAFLANGNIDISSNMNAFRGIMYANGSLILNSEMTVYGTAVGSLGFGSSSNIDFNYDLSAYAWALDSAGIGITGLDAKDAVLIRGRWQELPPL